MAITPGTRIGSYEIAAQIGAGGMGEVYRATDTNLGRQVAIKVLPEAVASDAERLARFDREARTLAALNHPNIAAIYGLERSPSTRSGQAGMTALVMELVEGPTLADRIAEGPMPVGEALGIAKQIADALEAAHEQSIVHRDLKPANVKVRPDGTVKVLDFGLAKALEPATVQPAGGSMSPTMTTPAMSQAGMILGTAAYMAPEQARGRPVTRRADVWAFGVVVYEMLSGVNPFAGDDVSQTLARVIEREPEWPVLPPGMPQRLHQLLRLCLQKDPRRRLSDMSAVRLLLAGAFDTPFAGAVETPRLERPWWRHPGAEGAIVSIALLAAVVMAVLLWRAMRPVPQPVQRFMLAEAPIVDAASNTFAISPDGSRIAYISRGPQALQLKVRRLDALEASTVAPDGGYRDVAFSPDGRSLAFFDLADRSLKRVPVDGGPVDMICQTGNVRGISWGPDDTIIFTTTTSEDGLWRVPARGGEAQLLTKPDTAEGEQNHSWPEVLPGARAVLYTIVADRIEESRIGVLSLETLERRVLIEGGSRPRYVAPGRIVFAVGTSLRAVRFDLDRLEVVGDPEPLPESVASTALAGSLFAVSDSGMLLYAPADVTQRRAGVWVDRGGRSTATAIEGIRGRPLLSPDGRWVAFERHLGGDFSDIWVLDLESGREVKLTDDGRSVYPLWTPDSSSVTHSSGRAGGLDLYSKSIDLSGDAELVVESATDKVAGSWTSDGRTLVYYELSAGGGTRDIWATAPGGEPTALVRTEFN